ncbi:MAG: nickel-dependent lactate racemase, partial [Bacillota bacterium]
LYRAGLQDEQITVLVALGIHRPLTDAELTTLVGREVRSRVAVVNHDPDDVVDLGQTSRGTPVVVNRLFAEASLRICTGNIDLHFFAGYAGGAKAMMPGISTREAIRNNHRMMTSPESRSGNLERNPVRQDIDEAGKIARIDFILNAVLNETKQVVGVVAGDPIAAHRMGCRLVDRMYKVDLPQTADLVIAGAGGYPKDLNVYQAQKALDNASHAVRAGGVIIVIARCHEGLGEDVFEQWVSSNPSPEEVIRRIEQDFVMGGHKAAAIARVRQQATMILVSELDPSLAEKCFFKPARSIEEAIQMAQDELGENPRTLLMPYAGYTLPQVRDER